MKSLFFILFVFFTVSNAEMIGSYDKDFLLAYSKNHPKDLKSRELLLAYFYKKENKKMIVKFSEEIYSLNPNDTVLKKVVNKVYNNDFDENIINSLKKLYKSKDYIRYINFYQAILDTNRKVPDIFHINAIYSAVETNNFKLAKKILEGKKFSMTPYLSEVMKALDRKLYNGKNL